MVWRSQRDHPAAAEPVGVGVGGQGERQHSLHRDARILKEGNATKQHTGTSNLVEPQAYKYVISTMDWKWQRCRYVQFPPSGFQDSLSHSGQIFYGDILEN